MTLTLNPSLDRTVEVDRLVPGTLLRTSAPTVEPGGKGVNISRALAANGIRSVAVVPVAGTEGAELARQLGEAGVDGRFVPVGGRTRSNIAVVDAQGRVTKLNEPGSVLEPGDLDAIGRALRGVLGAGDWLVASGRGTPGLAPDDLGALLDLAGGAGARLAVDTSGRLLRAAVDRHPQIVKPNRAELAEFVGRALDSIADVILAAEQLRAEGVELVLVSLGPDGAVLVGRDLVLVGESPIGAPVSTVGAGDCFLAGFLSRFSIDEADLDGALVEALRWGAAAACLPGSAVPGPDDLGAAEVRLIRSPDLDRPLVAT